VLAVRLGDMGEDRVTASQYIRRETLISIAINCFFSALFFFVVFGGKERIPVWGLGNWVFDFLPQSFMIALLSTIVPGAIAVKRLRSGRVQALGHRSPLPRNLLLRGLVLAAVSAIVGAAAIALLVAAATDAAHLEPVSALTLKIAYAALLSILITPPGLRAALVGPEAA